MTNRDDSTDDVSEPPMLDVPVLEAPPAPDAPTSGVAGLFDESTAMIMSKFTALDAIYRLTTRDCRFSEFTRELLVHVMKVVKSEAGSILEVDKTRGVLFFRSAVGQSSDTIHNFVIPLGKGIVGYVAESLQPLVVTNVEENQRHLKSIGDAIGFKARNIVCVPIVIRGKIFGVIELLNRVGEENYTSSDIELLSYLSEVCAKAIEIRMMIAWAKQFEKAEKSEKTESEAA